MICWPVERIAKIIPIGRLGEEEDVPLDIIVPVMMAVALLWWIGRGISWLTKLLVIAVTLALIIAILSIERGGLFPP